MHDNERIVTQWNWQKIIKISLAIIVLLYIVRAFYSVHTASSMMDMASNMVSTQEANFKRFDTDSKAQINRVQDGIANGAKAIEEKAKNLEDKFANFADDFSQSLEAELVKIREQHRKDDIRAFLNRHFHYYDAALYEADRKKFIESKHHELPDYAQYDALRKTALNCHIARHNYYEERYYKNKIAELKSEHKENLIKSVPKPDYWKWPLTKNQLETITFHPIPVFDVMTLQGKCFDV